jgi:hypothetical protein
MDACIIVRDANGLPLACVEGEPGQRTLVTDVDPAAQSRAPLPAGSVASTAATAATAASYPQANAAATATSATTMSCTAAAAHGATAHVAAAHVAAAAATAMASAASAASRRKPYAGAKFSFFVENVKGPQAHIKHFLLGEENSLPSVLGRHVCCRRVCRCAAHHRQRNPGSRPHG